MFAIGGKEDRASDSIEENRKMFEQKLKVEQNNVTLPGEQELADDLTSLMGKYFADRRAFFALRAASQRRRTKLYFAQLLPTFNAIKRRADDVLEINQGNMEDEATGPRRRRRRAG